MAARTTEHKSIENLILTRLMSIRDAIAVIDRAAAQIALVVDDTGRLLGTVTDGDVRRGLLRGETLESPVEQVMFRNFRSLHADASEAEALRLMRKESIHQIPGVDFDGRVVRLFLLEELIEPRSLPNPVVIMAGGQGKRLRPLTDACPKPMIRVNGKPLLEIVLEQCIDAGFREFYFAVNYLKAQIIDYFQDGGSWDVSIEYLEEKRPLGTAGALSLLPQLPADPLLVLNGDVLTRIDYNHLLRFHAEHEAAATMCVREHTTQIPYGVANLNDLSVLSLEEKPVLSHHVNAGIYFLEPDLLDLVPDGRFFDMPTLLENAIQQQHSVRAFPIHEYWLDIGLPEALERAHGEWQ